MKKYAVLFFALALVYFPVTAQAGTQVNLSQITNTSFQERDALISGDILAYTTFGGSGGIDIWGYDFKAKDYFPIISNAGEQFLTGIEGNLIVYTEINEQTQTGKVHLYNLKTNEDTLITPGSSTYDYGVTDGKDVVYVDGGACGLIMDYNIKSKITRQLASNACVPKISDRQTIWTENGAQGLGIYGYNFASNNYSTIYIGTPDTINLFKDNVVWMTYSGSNYRIMLKDLHTGEVKTLLNTSDYYVNFPAVSDKYAVWGKSLTAGQAGVEGINLKTGEIFEIYPQGPHQNTNLAPTISKNSVVWQAWRTGNGDIYMAELRK